MIQKAINRIEQMESYFDILQSIAKGNPSAIHQDSSARNMLQILTEYYESGQWLQDYELDEQKLLPQNLKRGILSQDSLYDFLNQI